PRFPPVCIGWPRGQQSRSPSPHSRRGREGQRRDRSRGGPVALGRTAARRRDQTLRRPQAASPGEDRGFLTPLPTGPPTITEVSDVKIATWNVNSIRQRETHVQ